MAATAPDRSYRLFSRIFFGFFAGFISSLSFYQLALEALHLLKLAPVAAYAMTPVPPFGAPAVISLAFWGGLWGILLALVLPLSPRRASTWVGAILFGAVLPTLVFWYVVLPLRGFPAGGGFHAPGIIVGPIVNAAWGLGTAVFLGLMPS